MFKKLWDRISGKKYNEMDKVLFDLGNKLDSLIRQQNKKNKEIDSRLQQIYNESHPQVMGQKEK